MSIIKKKLIYAVTSNNKVMRCFAEDRKGSAIEYKETLERNEYFKNKNIELTMVEYEYGEVLNG